MTPTDFAWFVAGLSLGIGAGLSMLASEQRARARQVHALAAAYEARIAEILKGRDVPPNGAG